MNLKAFFTLALCQVFTLQITAQTFTLSGNITDGTSSEPLIGATVQVGESGTTTDFDGNYTLELSAGKHTVIVDYLGYESTTKEITLNSAQVLDIQLLEGATLLNTATVTSGKFEKPLSEVTVSLQVLKPSLLENTNSTSVDDVLQKVPGVQIIDGQANIRGGSGYSYGAGSRVLLLMDDIPILQADAGFPNWDDIPVENIEQIEVVKGAASALYGSSALNGIINVRTAYAKSKPETKLSTFYTHYDDPADKNQIWYEEQPRGFGFSAAHKQKIKKLDLVLGGYYLNQNLTNKNEYDRYGRGNVGLRYRLNDRLVIGANANFNKSEGGNFFYWKSLDSLFVGADNTASIGERTRYNIDPFVSYFDNSGNRHKLLGRFHSIDNQNNANHSNSSNLWSSEYQFQRKWAGDWVTTAGGVYMGNAIIAELYGDTTFSTQNMAVYGQVEKKFFDRLNVSAGFRYETNQLNTPEVYSRTNLLGLVELDTIPNGKIVEAKPVFRLGLNYQAAEFTFLRGSWGQGYRFPTLAEAFISTSVGGLPISPNPDLTSETGWSAELGLKQGLRVGGFDGYWDVSAFWSTYKDMMEFNLVNLFPTGFQSQNIGNIDIKGFETTLAGKGDLFGLPTTVLAGYTFINPQFKEFDPTVPANGIEPTKAQINAAGTTSDENILKYRSRHTAKFDVESSYKAFSLGFAFNYNSAVEAIDPPFNIFIVGLQTYREENDGSNFISSLRASVKFLKEQGKFSIIVNNLTNELYSNRPGLMEAPRAFTGRLDWKF